MNIAVIFSICILVFGIVAAPSLYFVFKKKSKTLAKYLAVSALVFSSAALLVMCIAIAKKGEPQLFFFLADALSFGVFAFSSVMLVTVFNRFEQKNK